MKIGIISDTHDQIEKTQKALSILEERVIKTLIHCGDFCAPFMMMELSKFRGDIHCVFGNTDDRYNTPIKAKEQGINFHGDFAELELGGRKIAVNHYPEIAEAFATTGKYDSVFYGHNHTRDKKKIGETLLVNPGEIMGWKSKSSLAIYDTETNDVEFVEIE
jgi:uncharacterized protein